MASGADLSFLTNEELVEGVRTQDYRVINEFYRRFERRLTFIVLRCGAHPQDTEDIVHDTIFVAVTQIQKGDLDCPKALASWMIMIAKRTAWNTMIRSKKFTSLDEPIRMKSGRETPFCETYEFHNPTCPRPDPERAVILKEQKQAMLAALPHLKPLEIEILTRFYLYGQKPDQIQIEMGLTETQYRLRKSRAKQRLTEATRKIAARQSRYTLADKLAA
jgi:RNA polymerase sigma factor (sigma-70 family)